jgi:cell division septum initiation protein DivIVA
MPVKYTTRHITPQDITGADIPLARFGRRGYDEAKVDAFHDHIAKGVQALHAENTELKHSLNAARIGHRTAAGNGDADGEEPPIQAVHILSKAQQTADRYVANAQDYSRQMAEDARRRRDEVLAEARVRANLILQEASSSGTQAAAAVPSGQPPLNSSERRDLEAEIAYLRAYSDVCRTHLRAYLESLTRSVEAWQEAVAPGAIAASISKLSA